MFKKFLQKNSVGLDISDRTIEVVELGRVLGRDSIVSLNRKIIPDGLVKSGLVVDEIALAKTLEEIFASAKPEAIGKEEIIFGLPERHFYISSFPIGADLVKNKKALEAMVEEEAEKRIPLPRDRRIIFSKIVRLDPGQSEMMVFAVDRQAVASWDIFFKKFNFKVKAFDLETLATWRGMSPSFGKKNVCVIDLGANTSNVAFFNQFGIQYSFVSRLAGDYLTHALASLLKVSDQEAEILKIKNGLAGPDKKVSKALESELEKLSSDFNLSINNFELEKNFKTDLVVLAGGTSKLAGLESFLNQKLGIKTIVPKVPPIFVNRGEHRQLFFDDAYFYLEALGLAIRGRNETYFPKEPLIFLK